MADDDSGGAIRFFLPILPKAKQADRSAIRWRWSRGQLTRCPFCRNALVGPPSWCSRCNASWSKVSRHKVPFVGHMVDAKVDTNAKALVTMAYQHAPREPWTGPCRLDLVVVFPWLKSHRDRTGLHLKHTAPDVDNLHKQLADVIEAAGFVGNDSQFACGETWKLYGDTPGVLVYLTRIIGSAGLRSPVDLDHVSELATPTRFGSLFA